MKKNKDKKLRIGILLGRFEPFHLGHLNLIRKILSENDYLVIIIGSIQRAENPKKKVIDMLFQLQEIAEMDTYTVHAMTDPDPIDTWVEEMVSICKILGFKGTTCTLYRADRDLDKYKDKLKKYHIRVKQVKRESFYHLAANGIYYKASSATEVRRIKEKAG